MSLNISETVDCGLLKIIGFPWFRAWRRGGLNESPRQHGRGDGLGHGAGGIE